MTGYLGQSHRRLLLIAGAGFDPRSTLVAEKLCACTRQIRGIFFREERPTLRREMIRRADSNVQNLKTLIPDSQEIDITIFAIDGAVIGGREAARVGVTTDLTGITDVVVDFSALSKGVSFPLVRQLLERIESASPEVNLHIFVADEAGTDDLILGTGSDKVGPIHGFRGMLALSQNDNAAKLWLPQLNIKQRTTLRKIYQYLQPQDICPILPFPCTNPRQGDELADYFRDEFESVWRVDARSIVYAAEGSPLDLYRTILRIDDARSRIFAGVNGSLIVLSPVGSKVTSVGALMAAMERDFPVIYVETVSYEVDFGKLDARRSHSGDLVHVWLHGEAYGCT